MKTYLDHQFWTKINVVMQDNNDDLEQEAWRNFKRFLKKESDVFLNIPLDAQRNIEYQTYNELTSGRGKTAKLEVKPQAFRFMNGPLLFQNEFVDPDIFLLLEPKDQEHLKKWKEKNGFLIHGHQDLLKSWLIYRQIDTTQYPKSFSVRPNARFGFNMDSFNVLSIYKHPVTDIVISDRYLFSDEELLKKNLPLLLEATVELKPNINCSLFGSLSVAFKKNPEELKNICTSCLEKFKDMKLEVILDNTERFKEHDRHFITNYFYFKPGDSFSLFLSNDRLKTKGTSIDIKSLFDFSEMEAAKNTIENLLRIRESSTTKSKAIKMNRLFNLVSLSPCS
ncbi:MAG: hypothetical protein ICV79_19845 [Flavisolibacter sp.]|nr:hypothetical protein [Flavisolibacter sp.]